MKKLHDYLINQKNYTVDYVEKHLVTQEVINVLNTYKLSLRELCFRIKNNIPFNKVFLCKNCNKPIIFRPGRGYQDFCCNKCSLTYRNKSPEFKAKIEELCMRKYGCKHPMQAEVNQKKRQQTCKNFYGGPSPQCSKKVREKTEETCKLRFGYSSPFESPIIQEKITQTLIKNLGVEHPAQNKSVRDKMQHTTFIKHGVLHYSQHPDFNIKVRTTKKKNGTQNSSKEEEDAYILLLTKFSKDDIIRQYTSEDYPFNCDFYIKSLDLFIEYNGSWTHGWHNSKLIGAFDKTNSDHMRILNIWESRAKNSEFYRSAIYVWTVRDPLKYETAKKNNLNYKIFWTIEEVKDWINNLQ